MFAFGVAGLGGGIYLDSQDIWADLSFLTNVVTSLVSFLIGLPIAFYIVATVIESREDTATKDKIDKISQDAWNNLRTALALYPADKFAQSHQWALEIWEDYRQVENQMASARGEGADRHAAYTVLTNKADNIETLLGGIKNFEAYFNEMPWAAVQDAWQWLNNTIRVKRVEAGLDWLESSTHVQLSAGLNAGDPSRSLFVGVEVEQVGPMLTSVGELPSLLRSMSSNSIEEICDELFSSGGADRLRGKMFYKWYDAVKEDKRRWQSINDLVDSVDPAIFG